MCRRFGKRFMRSILMFERQGVRMTAKDVAPSGLKR